MFWRWEEWILASRDEWTEGVLNAADKKISEMRFAYVGPRTNEAGETEEYENEQGEKVLNIIAPTGVITKKKEDGNKKEEWTLNEWGIAQ